MLALWEFDFTFGSGASSTAQPVLLSSLVGSSANRDGNTFAMLPDDYWEARAATLKEDKKGDASIPEDQRETDVANKTIKESGASPERQALLASLKNAGSLEEMKSISEKLRGNT